MKNSNEKLINEIKRDVNLEIWEKRYLYGQRFRIKDTIKMLNEKQLENKKILDVGMGSGLFMNQLRNTFPETSFLIDGIELQDDVLELGKSRGFMIKKCNIEIENFPYQNDFFDIVFCTEVIEHTHAPVHVIQEVNRVLKNKGLFIFSVPNVAEWQKRLLLLLGKNIYYSYNSPKNIPEKAIDLHQREYTISEVKKLLSENGFKVEQIGTSISGWTKNLSPVYIISRFLSFINPSLGHTIIAKCKKVREIY